MDNRIDDLRQIDENLIAAAATPGQDDTVLGLMDRRRRAVDHCLATNPSLEQLRELQGRTRHLTAWLQHGRRTAIADLSALEKHLRYLREQAPSPEAPIPTHIDINA